MGRVKYYEKELGIPPEFYFWDDTMNKGLAKDSRQEEWKEQREKYGFDERELWSLKTTIAAFVYPRLKHFSEVCTSYPIDAVSDTWADDINKMAEAFKLVILEDSGDTLSKEAYKEIKEGLRLFADRFLDLWD